MKTIESVTKKTKKLLPITLITAALSTSLSQGALIVLDPLQVVVDQTFNNTTTNTGAPTFAVVSTSGIGTPTYTINYRYTTDLSAYGYSPTSSFDFAMTVTTTDGWPYFACTTLGRIGASCVAASVTAPAMATRWMDLRLRSRRGCQRRGQLQR